MTHSVLDLFAGIGGFSLGLERTGGFDTVAFCEICPKARKVLSKHWPNVKQYTDIRELTGEQLKKDGIEVDVITGGFPCQDISCAGKGKGIKAERSGLWSEMFRLIRDVRPTWAIIENVSALRSKGLTLVLQNLCEIGYCAEWHCIPASAVGAPHQRDRIWIVAYPTSECPQPRIRETLSRWKDSEASDTEPCSGSTGRDTLLSEVSDEERPENPVANSSSQQRQDPTTRQSGEGQERKLHTQEESKAPHDLRCEVTGCGCLRGEPTQAELANPDSSKHIVERKSRSWRITQKPCRSCIRARQDASCCWAVEPNVGRVAHGIPKRVDRLKQLGNSVVPQIPELLGYAILECERAND